MLFQLGEIGGELGASKSLTNANYFDLFLESKIYKT